MDYLDDAVTPKLIGVRRVSPVQLTRVTIRGNESRKIKKIMRYSYLESRCAIQERCPGLTSRDPGFLRLQSPAAAKSSGCREQQQAHAPNLPHSEFIAQHFTRRRVFQPFKPWSFPFNHHANPFRRRNGPHRRQASPAVPRGSVISP